MQQQGWSLVEKMVFTYLQKQTQYVRPATLEEQYKDIDIVFRNNDKEYSVSVKYMPKAVKTGNFSFETRLISVINTFKDGWFEYGESDITMIVLPKQDEYIGFCWMTDVLKKMVRQSAFRTVRLTGFQKATNSERFYQDAENLLVKIKDITPVCFKLIKFSHLVNE